MRRRWSAAATGSATSTSTAPAREHAADQRPAGDQRGGLAVEPDGRRRSGRRRPAIPRASRTPRTFNPLLANITYMPRDYKTTLRSRAGSSPCSASCSRTWWWTWRTWATAARTCCCSRTTTRRAPNNAAGSLSLAARRPIPEYGDITYAFNGGKSEYQALQVRFESRLKFGLMFLSSFTWSRAQDNGVGLAREPRTATSPAPQDFNNLEADYGYSAFDQPYNSTTSLVWELPFGKGRRFMSDASGLVEGLLGGWQVSGIFDAWSGERVNLRYAPAASFQVSGITQDFRGANDYRPNVTGDPLRKRRAGARSRATSTRRTSSSPPTRASPSATRSATACRVVPSIRSISASQVLPAAVAGREAPAPDRGLQPAQQDQLPRAERQPQRRGVRHDHHDLRRAADPARREAAVLARTIHEVRLDFAHE